jgi:hypothetical protein
MFLCNFNLPQVPPIHHFSFTLIIPESSLLVTFKMEDPNPANETVVSDFFPFNFRFREFLKF